ncbi:amino acid adenylation domain-containing protein [Leisingera aquaemixtae]|uniref:amino acid adenylation domain-containing protein n=1 Tax=Leisingera aquaemixtae TaxID=1396826 RepID=UPI0021A54CB6|nr:amino acid adenylation domain-containing protein [Leisingera aquaemixtae]UWQ44997.1 amino acid adenylation domain-containing protein [Leisingera aquaemixtae]
MSTPDSLLSKPVAARPQQTDITRALLRTASERTSLVDMLMLQVRCRSEEIAVCDDTSALRYSDLAEYAARLAARLKRAGVGAGSRVGLFADSSADMMAGLWGILFSGGAYLPLGTDYPVDRLTYMIRDAGVDVIVTQDKLRGRLAEMILPGVTVITLDALDAVPSGEDSDCLCGPAMLEDDLAYMIYTSGTTGAPKGVGISHAAILNQLTWLQTEQKLRVGEVILQKTPVSFDAAQWELLAVCCGVRVVMGRPGVYRDPEALIEQVKQHGVTMLQGVPTLLQALVDLPAFENCTTLTSLFSGGEALTRKLATRIFEAHPGCRLVNLYGPTECTINATAQTVDPAGLETGPEMIPIGQPAANTSCWVLDENLQPVAEGVSGELYIGGRQLANGYHNRDELTAERFITWISPAGGMPLRLYKTGDLVRRNPDGGLQFQGRADNQVKFRGYRIELDEIRLAIENHDWVKAAGVFIKPHARTGQPVLAAGIELNPREAPLMDQGNAGAHHHSKKSRLQVRAQLSGAGLRSAAETEGRKTYALAGKEADAAQRQLAFARKTYRFYEGGEVSAEDVLSVLTQQEQPASGTGGLEQLSAQDLGYLLRWLGQFTSAERLLPKHAYASPGALNATQVYVELANVAGFEPGYYYYHPARHELVLTAPRPASAAPVMQLHFVGKFPAIEPVYKNNIREVLEFETGHILGLMDHILPAHGLGIGAGTDAPDALPHLHCGPGHVYIAGYAVTAHADRQTALPVDFYVQAHGSKVSGLAPGHYAYRDGGLQPFSRHIMEQRHVIAINQRVYQRASGMISMVSRDAERWHAYIDLGRSLQRVQQNSCRIGTMSSGYSSKSGNDLVAATRLKEILNEHGLASGACYSAVFGKVSAEQMAHEGMHEDSVHMEGPAELIRRDLQSLLPDYMVPSKLALVPSMPYSASGKVDVNALKAFPEFDDAAAEREIIKPRNDTETALAEIWCAQIGLEDVSVQDDFFEIGGDSLKAVKLVQGINRAFDTSLPVQVLFEDTTIEALARRLTDGGAGSGLSRAVPLKKGAGSPVFCWPGLGGYPMNLRHLARALDTPRPVIGVQASGVNPGEQVCGSIQDMAARDAELIREAQPEGPYTLWGYSFGARVAYETAYQLEQAGCEVAELTLIAPGSPELPGGDPVRADEASLFRDASFLTILYSVFSQTIAPERVAPVIETVSDLDGFAAYIAAEKPDLDPGTILRITRLVAQTYAPEYGLQIEQRQVAAPVRLFKAAGDNLSFLEEATRTLAVPAPVHALAADHYELLKPGGVSELAAAIRRHVPAWQPARPETRNLQEA